MRRWGVAPPGTTARWSAADEREVLRRGGLPPDAWSERLQCEMETAITAALAKLRESAACAACAAAPPAPPVAEPNGEVVDADGAVAVVGARLHPDALARTRAERA